MAQVVNDTDKLTYILTEYGLKRVTEALTDTTLNIKLTKIKVGDANFEYYVPQENATELVHPIPNGEFNIIAKELLEDKLTVSLRAFIPENFDNCEIREVGIYETINGEDKLFALSTQQPIVKPSTELYYFSTVDYYAFLKSQNLAEIYDQIVLDPDEQLVSQEQLEELMRTIAFTESNLMEQINGNSRVIGLNRAEQLRQKIETNRNAFGYTTAYNIYSLMLNAVDAESIFGYWLFNYPRRTASTSSVTDISPNRRNLSTNKPINVYNRIFDGIMPVLKFNAPNYFYLNQSEGAVGYNAETFTIVGNPTITELGIASNFSATSYLTAPEITAGVEDTAALYFNFTVHSNDIDQNIAYTENPYTFSAYFSKDASELMVKLGDGTQWLSNLYIPIELGTEYNIRLLFNATGAYLGVLENDVYVEKVGVVFTEPIATDFGKLILGAPENSLSFLKGSIDLKGISFWVNGKQIFSGSNYSTDSDMSFLTGDRTADIPFSMFFAVEPLSTGVDRTLMARSNYATTSNVFEVTETANNALRIKLFADSNNYVTFESYDNTVPTKAHSLAFSYDAQNQTITAFAGGQKINMNRTYEGTYRHMNAATPILYGFTYTENGVIWADDATDPSKLLNKDGTPYTGDNWNITEGHVFFDDFLAHYDESKNESVGILYAWNYNDGLDDHTIYTKELELQENTVLYNEDRTVYTGTSFVVVQSGAEFVIQYRGNTTEYAEEMNIPAQTLYAFYYEGNLMNIWANSSSIPSVLYTADGNLYNGTNFYLEDNIIYYKDGGVATYNSLFNVSIPSLPVTSYITGANGKPEKYIDSNIGVVIVLKAGLKEEWLRSFALNLESALGNNPCITI